jgi:large conductance mechanosensitive channel protein
LNVDFLGTAGCSTLFRSALLAEGHAQRVQDLLTAAVKWAVIDLAVAVIIGGAFGKITASLVSDILMPILGVLIGGVSFVGLTIQVGSAVIGYGKFLQSVVDFLIIAFAGFPDAQGPQCPP